MFLAKQLINNAVDSACDTVKFQKLTFVLVHPAQVLDAQSKSPRGVTQRAMIRLSSDPTRRIREMQSFLSHTLFRLI